MPSTKSRKPAVPAVESLQPKPIDLTPRLLSVQQAAAYTGATIWAVRQLYWSKEVAGFIAGKRLLLDRASLDAWIDRKLAERVAA